MRTSRPQQKVYVHCTGTKLRETELAVQFKFIKIREGVLASPMVSWIPLSQVQKRMTDPVRPGVDTMMVAEWILEKNGILDAPLEEPAPESTRGFSDSDFDDDISF